MINQDVKITATEIVRLLQQKYNGRGVLSNKDSKSTALLIMEYMRKLDNLNVSREIIGEYTQFVLQKSIDFKDFPPTTEQYFHGFSHWASANGLNKSIESNSFDMAFERFYDEMSIRYEMRWARNQISSVDSHKLTWKNELSACNATALDIANAKQAMLDSGIYTNSPPTLQSFIEILKISRLGMDIPLPEIAYGIASSHRNSSNMNVFVKAARAKIGYISLIDKSDFTVKQRFEIEYRRLINAYIDGTISIKDIEPTTQEATSIQPADKEATLIALQRMMDKLEGKL